tara:strand:- start:858 stop:1241 length:384 start_codon:yes stop_codon:yes gene_type:complete
MNIQNVKLSWAGWQALGQEVLAEAMLAFERDAAKIRYRMRPETYKSTIPIDRPEYKVVMPMHGEEVIKVLKGRETAIAREIAKELEMDSFQVVNILSSLCKKRLVRKIGLVNRTMRYNGTWLYEVMP